MFVFMAVDIKRLNKTSVVQFARGRLVARNSNHTLIFRITER
jgi:hypothetical protein